MELKVEGSDLQKLLESATMQALGEAGREALVKEVVKYLTTVPPSSYSERARPSPLMDALQNAARISADRMIREKIEADPEFRATIYGLYVEAFKRFNGTESREKLVTRMAERLSKAFDERDY